MSKKYNPDPLQFPEIIGIRLLDVHPPEGFKGKAIVHAPVVKTTQRQAKLDMVNETVEWITEEAIVVALSHAVLHVFN